MFNPEAIKEIFLYTLSINMVGDYSPSIVKFNKPEDFEFSFLLKQKEITLRLTHYSGNIYNIKIENIPRNFENRELLENAINTGIQEAELDSIYAEDYQQQLMTAINIFEKFDITFKNLKDSSQLNENSIIAFHSKFKLPLPGRYSDER